MKAEDFPSMLTALPDRYRYRERFIRAVRHIDVGLAAGEIPNTHWNESKSAINQALTSAFDFFVSEPFFYAGRYRDLPDQVQALGDAAHPQLHTLPGWEKRMAAFKVDHPVATAIRRILTEAKPLCEAAIALKDKIRKRAAKPVEEQKPKFVPKRASADAIELVREALVEITRASYEELRARLIGRYTCILDGYLLSESNAEKPMSPFMRYMRRDSMDVLAYEVASLGTTFIHPPLPNAGPHRVADADARLEGKAEEDAGQMQKIFVDKNLAKLASIIDAKRNLSKVKVVEYDVDVASLRGCLRMAFADGAKFDVQNSVVMARSVHGKKFYRFPLTFHDVRMPDGTPMKQPSEEKMNTEFAGRYFGTVRAPQTEQTLLESFGLRLGPHDQAKGHFPVEATYDAKRRLAEFSGDFEAELSLRSFKPLEEMSAAELRNELRWCDWAQTMDDAGLMKEGADSRQHVLALLDATNRDNAFENTLAARSACDNGPTPA